MTEPSAAISTSAPRSDHAGPARTPDDGLDAVVDDRMTSDELIMFLILLVVAGNETTRNALAGGLVAFTRFPEQRRKLLERPELIDSAVEEIVRYVTPVISFMRTVTEDHTYRGVDFVAGDRVFLLYQWANRDKAVKIAAGRKFFNQDPNILKFVMENPTDRVTYGDLAMVRAEFEELMQLSIDAGTLKRPVAY